MAKVIVLKIHFVLLYVTVKINRKLIYSNFVVKLWILFLLWLSSRSIVFFCELLYPNTYINKEIFLINSVFIHL